MGLGVNFDFYFHHDFIDERGTMVIWETAIRCPCRVEDPFAGGIDNGKDQIRLPYCPKCGGIGLLFVNPVMVKGLLTGMNTQRTLVETGVLQPGDAIFGLGPYHEHMAMGDRLTMTHPQAIDDGQVIVRNAALLGNNLQLNINLRENEDRLWYRAARVIYCVDEDGKTYQEGADFEIDGSKIIRWSDSRPRDKKAYTVKYEGFLEYIVFAPPMERRDTEDDLGQKVLLKRKHVYDMAFDRATMGASMDDLKTIWGFLDC